MEPKSKFIIVCDVCDISWEKHINESQKRYRREFDEEFNSEPHLSHTPVDVDNAEVTLVDCISLLKRVNEGPIGYTGPTGATGACGTCS